MIIDCHTHYWEPKHLGEAWLAQVGRIKSGEVNERVCVTPDVYRRAMRPAARSIVFGMQAKAAGIMVDNDDLADFVTRMGGGVIGFLSVDPTDPGAADEVERASQDLGLRGVKLGLPYQAISPVDERALRVFERCERLGLPVLVHQGAIFSSAGRMVEANPILLDDVALKFPQMKLIIAHLGHPWVNETAIVMRRNPNVFSDVAALYRRPTMMMAGLSAAHEYNVLDKVLFGTDYPFTNVEGTIEGLTPIFEAMSRTFPGELGPSHLEELLHRPTLELLELPDDGVSLQRPDAAGVGADGAGGDSPS
ncbi:MAG: amidohydrolase [Actinobacteria bacterium]|nr:amidohydrolase [Actinomycetota bacterium]